jgi:biopolymer transport protein ExbD
MPLRTHPDEQPVLNLTAMLDVMFLLIIFFVLNTKFLDDERQINLQVPQVTDQGKLAAPPSERPSTSIATARSRSTRPRSRCRN